MIDLFSPLQKKNPGPNRMNGSEGCEYKSFLKSLIVTSVMKFNLVLTFKNKVLYFNNPALADSI